MYLKLEADNGHIDVIKTRELDISKLIIQAMIAIYWPLDVMV